MTDWIVSDPKVSKQLLSMFFRDPLRAATESNQGHTLSFRIQLGTYCIVQGSIQGSKRIQSMHQENAISDILYPPGNHSKHQENVISYILYASGIHLGHQENSIGAPREYNQGHTVYFRDPIREPREFNRCTKRIQSETYCIWSFRDPFRAPRESNQGHTVVDVQAV